MKAKLLSSCVAMALALTATSASAVNFNGYFRSGVGVSTDGKMQTANKQLVGRLGKILGPLINEIPPKVGSRKPADLARQALLLRWQTAADEAERTALLTETRAAMEKAPADEGAARFGE